MEHHVDVRPHHHPHRDGIDAVGGAVEVASELEHDDQHARHRLQDRIGAPAATLDGRTA